MMREDEADIQGETEANDVGDDAVAATVAATLVVAHGALNVFDAASIDIRFLSAPIKPHQNTHQPINSMSFSQQKQFPYSG